MSVQSTIDYVDITRPLRVTRPLRTAGRRSWLRTAARDIGIVTVLLFAAELTLRIVAPQYGNDYYDRTLTASQPVTFNADGYRGTAVPIAKQPGEFRILSLGDSTTFGTGVSIEQTWPLQLREQMSASRGNVTAMNVALQGASLADMTVAYEERWSAYHPDVVTALISSNMISLAWMHAGQSPQIPEYISHWETASTLKERISRKLGRLCLPHFVSVNTQRAFYWIGVLDHRIADPKQPYGAMLAHGLRQGDVPQAEAIDAWSDLARELQKLRDAAARHGTHLVVGFSPCRFDLTDKLFDNEKNVPRDRFTIAPADEFRRLCSTLDIDCIDTVTSLRDQRQRLEMQRGRSASMYILFDYNHLNADGNAAVAGAMKSAIMNASSASH